MYPAILPLGEILATLAQLDVDLAARTRHAGCPHCGGPLHAASWQRKPRGAPDPLLAAHTTRWGLCCGACRKRTLPPSVLFCGRKVYVKAVLLLVVAARQGNLAAATLAELRKHYGVSTRTIRRWLRMFLERLPAAPDWARRRGRLSARVRDEDVPAGLLAWLVAEGHPRERALVLACDLIPPL